MEECWKDIKNYEGYYQVSNTGKIRSQDRYARIGGGVYRRVRGKELSPLKRPDGYLAVCLSINRKHKQHLIHRLVAEAFIDNPNNFPEVNHKDENRTNNCVGNLEWCNKSYNQLYSLKLHPDRAKTFGDNFKDRTTGESKSPWTKPLVPHKHFKAVLQKTLDGKFVAEYNSVIEFHHKTGLDSGFITKCCNNIYSTAYGYKWEWKPDGENEQP